MIYAGESWLLRISKCHAGCWFSWNGQKSLVQHGASESTTISKTGGISAAVLYPDLARWLVDMRTRRLVGMDRFKYHSWYASGCHSHLWATWSHWSHPLVEMLWLVTQLNLIFPPRDRSYGSCAGCIFFWGGWSAMRIWSWICGRASLRTATV